MIEIPAQRLSDELLTAIIESFILREGTDYGAREQNLETKVTQVRRQIDKGDVVVVYEEASETCSLLTRQEYHSRQATASDDAQHHD